MDIQLESELDFQGDVLVGAPVLEDRPLSHGTPAEPVLRRLPLARLIPQDVHSVMDYANGVATFAGVFMADEDDTAAKVASIVLGASDVMTSAMTDYRLSIAKVIPIEMHEKVDYLWGLTAISLPFALGYWKTSPKVALQHVIAGAGNILASLFTDYRAFRRR